MASFWSVQKFYGPSGILCLTLYQRPAESTCHDPTLPLKTPFRFLSSPHRDQGLTARTVVALESQVLPPRASSKPLRCVAPGCLSSSTHNSVLCISERVRETTRNTTLPCRSQERDSAYSSRVNCRQDSHAARGGRSTSVAIKRSHLPPWKDPV
jgi:hypothetical protein